jgi:hypothetical protein
VTRALFGSLSSPGDTPAVLGTRSLRRHGDGQPLAPFRPPPLLDLPPAGRSHPCQKTVRSLAPHVARLIGSLHKIISPFLMREQQFAISITRSRRCQFTGSPP